MKTNGKTLIWGLVAAAMALQGCATITRGKSEKVEFTSSPSGASMKTTLGHECTTPCAFEIDRNKAFVATFRYRGQRIDVTVDTKVQGGGGAATAGNILVGGLIGTAVDASSGAMLDHVPNPVHANFNR